MLDKGHYYFDKVTCFDQAQEETATVMRTLEPALREA
jgi:hypothetical protein